MFKTWFGVTQVEGLVWSNSGSRPGSELPRLKAWFGVTQVQDLVRSYPGSRTRLHCLACLLNNLLLVRIRQEVQFMTTGSIQRRNNPKLECKVILSQLLRYDPTLFIRPHCNDTGWCLVLFESIYRKTKFEIGDGTEIPFNGKENLE